MSALAARSYQVGPLRNVRHELYCRYRAAGLKHGEARERAGYRDGSWLKTEPLKTRLLRRVMTLMDEAFKEAACDTDWVVTKLMTMAEEARRTSTTANTESVSATRSGRRATSMRIGLSLTVNLDAYIMRRQRRWASTGMTFRDKLIEARAAEIRELNRRLGKRTLSETELNDILGQAGLTACTEVERRHGLWLTIRRGTTSGEN